MAYEQKNFEQLIGTEGLSEQLMKNHFTLYQGYVTNTNKLIDELNMFLKDGKAGTPVYSELKRRFGWEFNGMRLHEYYFENMIKNGKELNKNSKLFQKITVDFGTYENWEKDFKAVGTIRGIGWTILYLDAVKNQLFNVWINEHDAGHISGATPLLIMDVFEHAYMIDYGLKRPDYINAFFKTINWAAVNDRFDKVIK